MTLTLAGAMPDQVDRVAEAKSGDRAGEMRGVVEHERTARRRGKLNIRIGRAAKLHRRAVDHDRTGACHRPAER